MARKESTANLTTFVVVGSANLDVLMTVDRMPRPHEKMRADVAQLMSGGAGANTAAWLARKGRSVSLVTTVGSDAFGELLIDDLRESDVLTTWVHRSPRGQTGIAIVFTKGGDKRMVTSGGPSRSAAIDHFPRDQFSARVHLHVVGEATKSVLSLCRDARDRGATVSVESNGHDVTQIAPHADLILLNSDELRRLTGGGRMALPARARSVISRPGGWVVVTRGSRGATAVSDCSSLHEASPPMDVVDRTGAGDAFDAGFLDEWTKTGDVGRGLASGMLLASEVLGRLGSRPTGPST